MKQKKTEVPAAGPSKNRAPYRLLCLSSLLILTSGLWLAKLSGEKADLHMRYNLARQAETVSTRISVLAARYIATTPDFTRGHQYNLMKLWTKTYADAVGFDRLYVLFLRNGQLVSATDSLSPDDPRALKPDTVFSNPCSEDFGIFSTGQTTVRGPDNGRFKECVTATAAIADPVTRQVYLAVKLDKNASVWRSEIRKAQWKPILIALTLIAIQASGFILIRIRDRKTHDAQSRLHHIETVACAAATLILTLFAGFYFHDVDKRLREKSFSILANTKAASISANFQYVNRGLNIIASAIGIKERIDREDFRILTTPFLLTAPVQACLWIPEVPADSAQHFEAAARQENLPEFFIRNRNGGEESRPSTSLLYPVLYQTSIPTFENLTGYNLASIPSAEKAISTAMLSRWVNAADPIELSSGSGPTGILLFKPIYEKHRKGLFGCILSPNVLNPARYSFEKDATGLTANLFQLKEGEVPQWIACSDGRTEPSDWRLLKAGLHATIPNYLYGKSYMIVITPDRKWLAEYPLLQTKIALSIGLTLSVFLTMLVAAFSNRHILLGKIIRQRTAELQESEERLEVAVFAGKIGVWDRDIVSGRLIWNRQMFELYGIKECDFTNCYEAWRKYVHPDDLERAVAEISVAEQGDKDFDTEFRIIRPDGEIRHIRAYAKLVRNEDGVAIRMIGINRDITDQRMSAHKIQSQMEELSRWNQAVTGRETRVLELKQEVNLLLGQLGQKPKYGNTAV
jgi:PAS domain S-box-containing protein